MSLDVYLIDKKKAVAYGERIFVREHGQVLELTREEWDARYPGRDPVVVIDENEQGTVYESNVTHNLTEMAREVDLYMPLWRPDEVGITRARELAPYLSHGLRRLADEYERLQEFNPPNGWGDYGGFVAFVAQYLVACQQYPDAEVKASG